MKILLFGRDGQVGTHLRPQLSALAEVMALGRQEVDLAYGPQIDAAVDRFQPDVIVNAAAYTAVDRAEQEAELARRINADAPGVMARAAARRGAWFIHYSTDYVFDGQGREPYRENHATDALGVYGRTKLAGERAVREGCDRHLIFRTAWVYSRHGHNFLNTMLHLAQTRDRLDVVNDQVGSPTWAGAIAAGTAQVLEQVARADRFDAWGTYHMTCSGTAPWCEFARRIFDLAGATQMTVRPVTTAQYAAKADRPLAPRPAWSVLSNDRLKQTFGVELPPWEQALRQCLAGVRGQ